MNPRAFSALLFLLAIAAAFGTARATPADDVAAWDRLLATVPVGAPTIALGDQIVPIAVARGWRDRLAEIANPTTGRTTAAATQSGVHLWTSGNVYYSFNSNVSANHRVAFQNALREWETVANVHFIVRVSQANYVLVSDGGMALNGGNAAIGMVGGAQALNIGTKSWSRQTMLHEVGHSLGLIHEHQRSDRDTYVTITPAYANSANFMKIPTSINKTSYDFLSIMHYQRNAFSSDGGDTITPKPAYGGFIDIMGMQFNPFLSRLDRQGVVSMYGAGPAGSLNVTNTQDSGSGSLRAALQAANDAAVANPGSHPAVNFQIPAAAMGGNNYFTIALTSPLQPVLNTVVDSASQTAFTGNTNATGPEILLAPAPYDAADLVSAGVQMSSSGSELRNFVVSSFNGSGVEITGPNATGNVVAGCYIGTNPAGTAAAANVYQGVRIHWQAHDNLIGGTTAAARNVISGNTSQGVVISEPGTTRNHIEGNYIGLNAAGTASLPNAKSGVYIYTYAGGNYVGGSAAGAGNIISGNTDQGVTVVGPANANYILGNRIGLNPAGTAAIPNMDAGIIIFGAATNTVVGGAAAGSRNIISGNKYEGIYIVEAGTNGTAVLGNYIGLNANGDAAVGNGLTTSSPGVSIADGARQTLVGGGAASGAGNVISGNGGYGIGIAGTATGANSVYGNLIGLNAAGAAALPNASSGVVINGGSTGNSIGGFSPGAGNVLSGNTGYGLWISAGGYNNVMGNLIGLDATGLLARPNSSGGLLLNGNTLGNKIGYPSGGRNYITGNNREGIDLQGASNLIKSNTIGLNVAGATLGNGGDGIAVYGKNNAIGGAGLGEANLISGNGNRGVLIYDALSTGNSIFGNSIFGNTAAAIDLYGGTTLNGAGLTANDTGDADTGPNSLQNYPVLTGAVLQSATTVTGSLSSTASTSFRLEFFATPNGGPAGVGESRTYLGAQGMATNSSGYVAFNLTLAATVTPGFRVTATATNLSTGNTSELGPGVAVTVTDADHDGLPDSYETANGFAIGPNEAALDPDGDGANNLAEFYAGTNPHNAASVLRVQSVETVGNDVRVTIPTASGRNYRVEYTDNINDATAWRMLADQLLGAAGTLQVIDTGAASRTTRLYRVRLQQ